MDQKITVFILIIGKIGKTNQGADVIKASKKQNET